LKESAGAGRIVFIPSKTASTVARAESGPAQLDPRRGAHRRPGLDLLRALAIVLVLVYHAGIFGFLLPFEVQRFGWVGVDLFFVLSGYLIGGQLLKTAAGGKEFSITRFYQRRALRILPAYLVVLFVYYFLPATLRDYEQMPPLWKFLTFTQNLGLRGGTAFSHAWSLCIEFQFYLLLPLLVIGLSRRAQRGWLFVLPVALLVWSVFIRGLAAWWISAHYGESFGRWQQYVYYPTYARLDGLTIGVTLAAVEIFQPRWWDCLLRHAIWLWLPALAGLVLALLWAEEGLTVLSSALGFSLVAAASGIFLICALSPRLPFARAAVPGSAFLASIAYSLYLTHKIPIHWVKEFASARSLSPLLGYVLAMVLAVLAGIILFLVVERPFLRLRERQAADCSASREI
jgi:peptidoglycan/LPS O-acetylase OafA/YrhL